MNEWPLWVAGYLGIALFSGAIRLVLLKATAWQETWVDRISRYGPTAVILAGILITTAVTPPYDSLKWGLLSLILPVFIVPVLVLCYLAVSACSLIWPTPTIRKRS